MEKSCSSKLEQFPEGPSSRPNEGSSIDAVAIRRAYRRWAPIYDFAFGQIAETGRKHAVKAINRRHGKVLEVGVGTGLSLPFYNPQLSITGIDLSPDMLDIARTRIDDKKLKNIDNIYEMDATNLKFPDESFDTVVAMYVMTVVPDPERVMSELERVCEPGGEVILVNHFSQEEGMRGWLEHKLAPLAETLGWRPLFPIDRVMGRSNLHLTEHLSLRPFGLFTMLRFTKQAEIIADSRFEKESSANTLTSFEPVEA